jgi:isoleucyl-tRNA synthetase
MIDERLLTDTRLAMKVSSLGRAARSQASIKVRQPLSRVIIKVTSKRDKEGLERLSPQVLEELNVKAIEFIDSEEELDKPDLTTSSEGGLAVAMDCDVTPELAAEGLAREIVHRIQTMRRSATFDIADHIVTYYGSDAYVKQVMQDWADYIKQETLSRELVESIPEADVFSESYKLAGHEIRLAVKQVD